MNKMRDNNAQNTDSLGNKETLAKIDEILSHVKSIDAQMAWTIRAQAEDLKRLLLNYFSKRKRAAKVFLAVDGKRSSGEISEYLKIKGPNVSKELAELEARGLVEVRSWGIYRKSKIDGIIRLSFELRKDPDLADIK